MEGVDAGWADRTVVAAQGLVGRVVSVAPWTSDVLLVGSLPYDTAEEALRGVSPREGVDTIDAGPDVVYASRLIARAAQSRLSRLASLPIYQGGLVSSQVRQALAKDLQKLRSVPLVDVAGIALKIENAALAADKMALAFEASGESMKIGMSGNSPDSISSMRSTSSS